MAITALLIILVVLGAFMDVIPAILIFTPLFPCAVPNLT